MKIKKNSHNLFEIVMNETRVLGWIDAPKETKTLKDPISNKK